MKKDSLDQFFSPLSFFEIEDLMAQAQMTPSLPEGVLDSFQEVHSLELSNLCSPLPENFEAETPELSEKDSPKPLPQKVVEKAEKSEPPKQLAPALLSLDEIADCVIQAGSLIRVDRILYSFNGEIYEPLSTERFLTFLQRILPEAMQRRIGNIRKVEDAYDWLAASPKLPYFSAEDLYQRNRFLIPFRNGVYDAETGRLIPYTKETPIFFQLDAYFRPDPSPAPTWSSFIHTTFKGNMDDQQLLLEMIGYLLMPSNDGKVFFVLGTEKNSGKSQFVNFLTKVLGEDRVSNICLHDLKNRFALAGTVGMAANFSKDLPNGPLSDEAVARIKQVTGEKWIMVEAKCQPLRSAFITCKWVCATNHPIQISSNDPAFWDRLILLPFTVSCPKSNMNKDLAQDLYNERDSILSAAAKAAHFLIAKNFVFTSSENAERILTQWASSSDPATAFLDGFCRVTGSRDDYIEINELFDRFQEKFGACQMTLQAFSREVRARCGTVSSGNSNKKRIGNKTVNVVFGLCWKEEPPFT